MVEGELHTASRKASTGRPVASTSAWTCISDVHDVLGDPSPAFRFIHDAGSKAFCP